MTTIGGYFKSNDYKKRVCLMITREVYSNDFEGEGTLIITRGGYSYDYEGRVF